MENKSKKLQIAIIILLILSIAFSFWDFGEIFDRFFLYRDVFRNTRIKYTGLFIIDGFGKFVISGVILAILILFTKFYNSKKFKTLLGVCFFVVAFCLILSEISDIIFGVLNNFTYIFLIDNVLIWLIIITTLFCAITTITKLSNLKPIIIVNIVQIMLVSLLLLICFIFDFSQMTWSMVTSVSWLTYYLGSILAFVAIVLYFIQLLKSLPKKEKKQKVEKIETIEQTLLKLKDLYTQGLITEEEYNSKKQDLLNRI